jgi:hypothetical protein
MATTSERIKSRRLERMRAGQSICSFVKLTSDPEIRVAIVPLTEAEYAQCLELVALLPADDNVAGFAMRDRRQAQEILVRAIREENDLTQRVYIGNEKQSAIDEMMESMDVSDIDQLIDEYNEMSAQANPRADGVSEEELEQLKKVLWEMDWNEFSGRSWYALKRFLGLIMPELQQVNLLGSTSTTKSTTTSE